MDDKTKKILMDVLTDIFAGIQYIKSEGAKSNVVEGLQMIYRKVEKRAKEVGLEVFIPKKGEPFDEELHDAVEVVNGFGGNEDEEYKIVEVLTPGFREGNNVLKPAKVRVRKAR